MTIFLCHAAGEIRSTPFIALKRKLFSSNTQLYYKPVHFSSRSRGTMEKIYARNFLIYKMGSGIFHITDLVLLREMKFGRPHMTFRVTIFYPKVHLEGSRIPLTSTNLGFRPNNAFSIRIPKNDKCHTNFKL